MKEYQSKNTRDTETKKCAYISKYTSVSAYEQDLKEQELPGDKTWKNSCTWNTSWLEKRSKKYIIKEVRFTYDGFKIEDFTLESKSHCSTSYSILRS